MNVAFKIKNHDLQNSSWNFIKFWFFKNYPRKIIEFDNRIVKIPFIFEIWKWWRHVPAPKRSGYPRLKSCQRWRDRAGETRWKRYETVMTWPASIHKCFTTAILLSSVRVFRVHDTAWSFSTRPLTFGISLFLRFSFKWRHNERVLKLLVRSIDIIIIIMLQNRKY